MAADSAREIVKAIRELDDDAKAALGKELAPHIPVTLGRRGFFGVGAAALLGAGGATGAARAVEAGVGRAAAADGVVNDIDVLKSGDGSPFGFGNAVEFATEAISSATTIGNVTVVYYDSSVSGFTITIPASLEVDGMVVRFIDQGGSAASNNVTVEDSGNTTIATIDADSSIYEVWWDGSAWVDTIFTPTVDAGTVKADSREATGLSSGATTALLRANLDSDHEGALGVQYTDGVSTTATGIFHVDSLSSSAAIQGYFVWVTGSDASDISNRFSEIIHGARGAGVTVISSSTQGTVPGRTYTEDFPNIDLAMASDTFNISAWGLATRVA